MSRPHAAALVEDAWHRWLERALRRRKWRNRIIGFTGYGSTDFVRVFARVLLARDHSDHADHDDVTYGGLRSPYVQRRGWRSFFTAPAMGTPVEIRVGNHVAHGRSDRSGHVDVTFHRHGLSPGWHEVIVSAQHAEPVRAAVVIVDRWETFGMVSDIDDTVISTMLPRPMLAAWNTFVRHEGARSEVPGMAPLYRKLLEEHPGAPIIYVSTGAWNTAPTLTRFLKNHGYPARAAAAHRLGPDEHRLVPQRPGAQAGLPGPAGPRLPRDPLAAHRRRRPARPEDLPGLRRGATRAGRRDRDPPAHRRPSRCSRTGCRCPTRTSRLGPASGVTCRCSTRPTGTPCCGSCVPPGGSGRPFRNRASVACVRERPGVPELPEVQALVDFLAERVVGLAVTGVELGSVSVLKTFDPPPAAHRRSAGRRGAPPRQVPRPRRRRHAPGLSSRPGRLAALVRHDASDARTAG